MTALQRFVSTTNGETFKRFAGATNRALMRLGQRQRQAAARGLKSANLKNS